MSLINDVLQGLEKRHASESELKTLPPYVRAVPDRPQSPIRMYLVAAVIIAVLIAVAFFIAGSRQATEDIAQPGSLGVVIGGSGNGEQIAANKVRGVRAALAWSLQTARLSRQHNDANVLAVGARMHPLADAAGFVDAFLAEPFSGDPRHARRIEMLADYETDGVLPPLP